MVLPSRTSWEDLDVQLKHYLTQLNFCIFVH